MALGDFDSVFGPFGNVFDPAMGRVMASNPEALIPHFVSAGIAPPSGTLAGSESPYAQPNQPPMFPPPAVPPRPGTPSAGGVFQEMFPGPKGGWFPPAGGIEAAPTEPMAPSGGTSSDYYDLPGGGTTPATAPATTEPTPAPGIPLPPERPSTTEATAKGGAAKPQGGDATKKLVDALTGVKAPPAPAQPQLRPHSERGGAAPQGNPIASYLAQILGGGGGGAEAARALRLYQAVGGR